MSAWGQTLHGVCRWASPGVGFRPKMNRAIKPASSVGLAKANERRERAHSMSVCAGRANLSTGLVSSGLS
jgi:hypothetical protein